jgi:hypothetical protein
VQIRKIHSFGFVYSLHDQQEVKANISGLLAKFSKSTPVLAITASAHQFGSEAILKKSGFELLAQGPNHNYDGNHLCRLWTTMGTGEEDDPTLFCQTTGGVFYFCGGVVRATKARSPLREEITARGNLDVEPGKPRPLGHGCGWQFCKGKIVIDRSKWNKDGLVLRWKDGKWNKTTPTGKVWA